MNPEHPEENTTTQSDTPQPQPDATPDAER